MIELLREPWPWYVAGPMIGLFVPALLLLDSKQFGISDNLRHLCSAAIPKSFPRKPEFLRYDWKRSGGWNLAFALGIMLGGWLAFATLDGGAPVNIAAATRETLAELGLSSPSGLVPPELYAAESLLSWPSLILLVGGGFLVGFGGRYAGGCTSGHAISGLADRQLPSLIAVLGFFAGGLIATHALLPWVLR